MERKLASIQRIAEIKPIEGADAIEAVRVNGWWIVSKKGEYQVGDLCVYLEIDSWVPTYIAPFLTKAGHSPKVYNGVEGERLKTIKLRGQLSQGLVLSSSYLNSILGLCAEPLSRAYYSNDFEIEGTDVTELLGIQKWEQPEYAGTNQEARGNFPTFIKKTDQERVQNIGRGLGEQQGSSFEVTIKLDGSSLTAYVNGEDFGVCSRNVNLKDVEGNAFWSIAKAEDLHNKIRSTGRNLAVQGELIAPNIQSNHEKVTKPTFRCFSIWDIDKQEYVLPQERRAICEDVGIPHVPVVYDNFVLSHSVDELLELAEGDGMNVGVKREGLVFKSNTSQFSFKAVANSYLLKKG